MIISEYLYNFNDEVLTLSWIDNESQIIELAPACLTDSENNVLISDTFQKCLQFAYRKGYIN